MSDKRQVTYDLFKKRGVHPVVTCKRCGWRRSQIAMQILPKGIDTLQPSALTLVGYFDMHPLESKQVPRMGQVIDWLIIRFAYGRF